MNDENMVNGKMNRTLYAIIVLDIFEICSSFKVVPMFEMLWHLPYL